MKNTYINRLTSLTLMICLVFFMEGCHKENLPQYIEEKGIPVKVKLDFDLAQLTVPQATAVNAIAESDNNSFRIALNEPTGKSDLLLRNTKAVTEPLHNLWVFQFGNDKKIRKISKIPTTSAPVDNRISIEADLLTGEDQIIYLLSLGKQYGDIDLKSITSLEALESLTFDFVTFEDGIAVPIIKNEEDVPYRGSCSGITIIKLDSGDGNGYVDYSKSPYFSGAIGMQSLVSLVTFDFTFDVPGMTPFSLQLNNVATSFIVNDSDYVPSQFVNLSATIFKAGDVSDVKHYTASWYIAPNPQGKVPGLSESERYSYYTSTSTTITGRAPQNGSYIHFWASEDATPNRYALYYIFLGCNTSDDFNILPHSLYKYTTHINTKDDINDKRIVFKTLKQSIDFSVSAKESTGTIYLLRSGEDYDFDAHASMRPIEITALRGTVTVEILKTKESATAIDLSESWLKLSAFPNYTAAISNYNAGLTSALTNSITLKADIPGLFRLYLYSDENEKYVDDEPTKSENKRSLYMRFIFRTSTSVSQTYIVRLDQRAGFYMGQLGGEFVKSDAGTGYSKGLILESVHEASARYLSYHSPSAPKYAYTNFTSSKESEQTFIKIGGYELYDGRKTTISMAENKYNIPKISNNIKILNPKYIGNYVDENNYMVDLYQYKHHNSDGFVQRYCYDKNRDNNGNGRLDDDEIVWYLPSAAQALFFAMNYYTEQTDYFKGPFTQTFRAHLYPSTFYNLGSEPNRIEFMYLENSSTNLYIRCVRNVPIKENSMKGVNYYEEDGYAVIDATGLKSDVVENRVKNLDFVREDGRVNRYYYKNTESHPYEKKVSVRFRVAPRDINAQGEHVGDKYIKAINKMTWAEAAGYNLSVNTHPIVDGEMSASAESGCPMYKGKDGVENTNLGKWRLPTIHEINLISMMDQAMAETNTKTGYQPLFIAPDGFGINYWTAAEIRDISGSSSDYLNRAVTISKDRLPSSDRLSNQYIRPFSEMHKSPAANYYNFATRCIQDLPPTKGGY